MNKPFENLSPERLWHYFAEICKVPRPSKNEEKIAAYLVDFAAKHQLECLRDEAGNVLIRKPASPGKENGKGVILQSHLDMVGEKNSTTQHDFETDPIVPRREGEWIKATGTTLGADDGIGIAAQLAILESKNIVHGPLEALFTVDEETGLTGAFGLRPGFLKGDILLNLDSEDEGQIFIGCAGGKDTTATFPIQTEVPPMGMEGVRISVTGLKGGHSGDDIHKGLGNAVKLLSRILYHATRELDIRIGEMDAGNLRNAIAREGFATVAVSGQRQKELLSLVARFEKAFHAELHVTEPDLTIGTEAVAVPEKVLTREFQDTVLNVLQAAPHGVIAMSREIPGFVETSTNLASVKTREEKLIITTSQRSSVESSKEDIADTLAALFSLAGAEIEQSHGYPGWNPNPGSPVLKTAVSAYQDLFGQEPEVLAIHAGLECGLIGAIYPTMDMISFGPTIKGAHSPDERLHIPTVTKFWDLTLEILKRI